jgi:hypothetical protein
VVGWGGIGRVGIDTRAAVERLCECVSGEGKIVELVSQPYIPVDVVLEDKS